MVKKTCVILMTLATIFLLVPYGDAEASSADEQYEYAKSREASSHRLEAFIEGYNQFPDDTRFSAGINTSSESLLNWAERQGTDTIIDRAQKVLASPALTNTTEVRANDLLYEVALNYSASSQRLSASIDFYQEHGSSRLAEAINDSANSLLNWAESKGYHTIIDRSEKVLQAPALSSATKNRAYDLLHKATLNYNTSIQLEAFAQYYAEYGVSIFADAINVRANSLLDWAETKGSSTIIDRAELVLESPALSDSTKNRAYDLLYETTRDFNTSDQIVAYSKYYDKYEQSRFSDALNNRAQSLLDWANSKHKDREFATAISRYEMIIGLDGISATIKSEAEYLLHFANQENQVVQEVYTSYAPSLSEMVDTQMSISGTGPQTHGSHNNFYEGYIREDLIEVDDINPARGFVDGNNIRLRANAGTSSAEITQFSNGREVTIIEKVPGIDPGDSYHWYQIEISTSSTGWGNATRDQVQEYVSPERTLDLEHLILSLRSGATEQEIGALLNGVGTLSGTEKAFYEAGKAYSVNEIYLIAHAFLESGYGTSLLARGVEVDGILGKKTVYNMFGIAAYDGSAVQSASQYAYNQGWFTPEDAVFGGAKWIADNYVHNNSYDQNTTYKMRWNPSVLTTTNRHQYATDIAWSRKIANLMSTRYKSAFTHAFDIPKY